MQTYVGSCHCGLVCFEVRKSEPISILVDCDCSLCRRQGFIHTPVEDSELTILCGKRKLRLYEFGSKKAKYWFCPDCGCNTFNRSRTNPQRYSVNVRCLEDCDTVLATTDIWFVDGRNHPHDHDSQRFVQRDNPYRTNTGNPPPGIVPNVNPDQGSEA